MLKSPFEQMNFVEIQMLETMTRHEQCENRKTQLNANQHQQKSLDTLKRFHHIEEMDNKLEQAEINRQQLKANTYKVRLEAEFLACIFYAQQDRDKI